MNYDFAVFISKLFNHLQRISFSNSLLSLIFSDIFIGLKAFSTNIWVVKKEYTALKFIFN